MNACVLAHDVVVMWHKDAALAFCYPCLALFWLAVGFGVKPLMACAQACAVPPALGSQVWWHYALIQRPSGLGTWQLQHVPNVLDQDYVRQQC